MKKVNVTNKNGKWEVEDKFQNRIVARAHPMEKPWTRKKAREIATHINDARACAY